MFPFQCSVLNKGTSGTIFITSLVWRSPWWGVETGTSHTWNQHSTTRLSRRRSRSFHPSKRYALYVHTCLYLYKSTDKCPRESCSMWTLTWPGRRVQNVLTLILTYTQTCYVMEWREKNGQGISLKHCKRKIFYFSWIVSSVYTNLF